VGQGRADDLARALPNLYRIVLDPAALRKALFVLTLVIANDLPLRIEEHEACAGCARIDRADVFCHLLSISLFFAARPCRGWIAGLRPICRGVHGDWDRGRSRHRRVPVVGLSPRLARLMDRPARPRLGTVDRRWSRLGLDGRRSGGLDSWRGRGGLAGQWYAPSPFWRRVRPRPGPPQLSRRLLPRLPTPRPRAASRRPWSCR